MRHKNNNVAKIEIRSERIQGIMKEEPSIFIQYGTTIIAVLLLAIAIITINVIT